MKGCLFNKTTKGKLLMENIEYSWTIFWIEMFVLLSIGLAIYAFLHYNRNKDIIHAKFKWLLLIVMLPTIGPLLYLKLN